MLRPGQVDETVLSDELRAQFALARNVSLIEYTGARGGKFGHSYFRTNPHVASDLILTLRYDRPPGAAHGCPLKHKESVFWEIDDSYLQSGR